MKTLMHKTFIPLFLLPGMLLAQEIEVITDEYYLDVADKPAEITWLEPNVSDSVITTREIVLKAGIKSAAGVKKLTISINGINQPLRSRGFRPANQSSVYARLIEQPLQLSEGGNLLRVSIWENNGMESHFERTLLVQTVHPVMARNDYALLFATNEYDEWKDLVNPIEDARAVGKELAEVYGFKVEIVENATRDEVMLKLREYSRKSFLEDDQLFIFIAGHGHFDDIYSEGFLVTKDSKINDPSFNTYLSHARLRNVIDNIPARHILLAMDVCFGGTFDPLIARAGSRGLDLYNGIDTKEFIKRKLKYKTRKYITSGGKAYVSDGIPGKHSPFAAKLLEGLRSYGGNDGIITTQELYLFLERLNPEPKAGNFGDNEPGSDFVFVVKK